MDILKHKTKILAGVFLLLLIALIIFAFNFIEQNTLKQTNDSYTHEVGTKLTLNVSDFFDADEEKAAQISFDTSAVDTDTVGEYMVTASFKNKTFEIKVSVTDTTSPKVDFTARYLFTNDMNTIAFDDMIKNISEHSKWTAKLTRFEKYENLSRLNEKDLKDLTDTIPLPCDSYELSRLGTEEIPTEEGIYRAVMEISDEYGNASLEEIMVIYDATGARIEDTPDKTIYVDKEDLGKEPEIDKKDYILTDNVDGTIKEEDIQCELELRDADKHEWLVHVSYTDRAGNNSKAVFLITVKEKQKETPNTNAGGTPPGPTNNGDTTQPDNQAGNTPEVKDEYTPSQQKVINAGYGNVVQLDATTYAVLTHGDGLINGQEGNLYLRAYLEQLGLEPTNVSGGWIDSNNDWYCYVANNVHEKITPDDEEFWD